MQINLLYANISVAYLKGSFIIKGEIDYQRRQLFRKKAVQEADVVGAVNHFHTLETLSSSCLQHARQGLGDIGAYCED